MRIKSRIEKLENACDIKSNLIDNTNDSDKTVEKRHVKCWRAAFNATFIYHVTPPYFVFRERYVRAMIENNVEVTEATIRDDYNLTVKITRELDS